MEAMAQEWTDGRLDELSERVDRGFERVDTELKAFRSEMRTEFTTIRTEMGEIRTEISGIQRTMIQMIVALTAAMVTGFAGIFALLAAAL